MNLKKSQEQLQVERDRTLKEQLESINSNIKNIEQNQEQLATKNQENFSRSQEEIEKISNRVGDLENNIRVNERANRKMVSNQSSYPSETSVSYPELSPQTQNPISLEESNLAKRYNRDRDAFSQQAINVTATEESLTKLRIGSSSRVIFEKNRRGNYSIIKENGTEYLVPSNNLRLNQHNYKAIEDFFDCKNLQLEGNFELLKPARVSALPGGETWQFEERGILQF
jgi:predicted nuclease with TOPRIM domain